MGVIYCNAFNDKSESLKIINGVLTTSDKMKIEGEPIKSTCGGFYLDSSVFKIDEKTGTITKKAVESISEVIQPYCGGIKLDGGIFEKIENCVDLKPTEDAPAKAMVMNENEEVKTPMAHIIFDSLESFTVELMDENDNIIEPTQNKEYVVPKGKTYHYIANNEVKQVTGSISTSGRKINFVETITF